MSSHRCAAQPFLATLASTIPVAVLTATILTVGALRLPLDVLPGAAYVALLGLPVLARHGDSPRANPDFQFGVYGGTAYTMKSRLHLSQPGGTDLSFHDVSWVGEPFRTPPYYGLRAIYWLPASAYGLMGDFTHIKARAERGLAVKQSGTRDGVAVPVEEPLSATFKRLEFTHGYNLLTLNLLRRGDVASGRLLPYAGAGFGMAYPHVEVQRSSAPVSTRTYEYQLAGPAMQLLGGVEWRLGKRLSFFVEYKLSCALISGDLVGGGAVNTRLCTHQLLAGPAVHL